VAGDLRGKNDERRLIMISLTIKEVPHVTTENGHDLKGQTVSSDTGVC